MLASEDPDERGPSVTLREVLDEAGVIERRFLEPDEYEVTDWSRQVPCREPKDCPPQKVATQADFTAMLRCCEADDQRAHGGILVQFPKLSSSVPAPGCSSACSDQIPLASCVKT